MSAPDTDSHGRCSGSRLDRKDQCVGTSNKALFFAALPLTVIGKSGFAASLEELIEEQTRGIISRVFKYLIGNHILVLVHLIGAVAIPYAIKRWSTRFGVPAVCMAVGTFLFLTGFRSFQRDAAKPGFLTRVYNLFAKCVPCLTRF